MKFFIKDFFSKCDHTAQKMKFSMKNFFSKCDQIRRKLRIWSHLLKKSLMENFIFCTVPNPQFPADLVTFTEEILKGKLHFLCGVTSHIFFFNKEEEISNVNFEKKRT